MEEVVIDIPEREPKPHLYTGCDTLLLLIKTIDQERDCYIVELNEYEKKQLRSYIYNNGNPLYENSRLRLTGELCHDDGYDSLVYFLNLTNIDIYSLREKIAVIKSFYNNFTKKAVKEYYNIQALCRTKLQDAVFLETLKDSIPSDLITINGDRLIIGGYTLSIVGDPYCINKNKYGKPVAVLPFIGGNKLQQHNFGEHASSDIEVLVQEVLYCCLKEVYKNDKSGTIEKKYLGGFENIKVVNGNIIVTDIGLRISPILKNLGIM